MENQVRFLMMLARVNSRKLMIRQRGLHLKMPIATADGTTASDSFRLIRSPSSVWISIIALIRPQA